MVSLIQKALQLYAARALCRGSSEEAGDRALDEVLSQEEQFWERLIREGVEQGNISPVRPGLSLPGPLPSLPPLLPPLPPSPSLPPASVAIQTRY